MRKATPMVPQRQLVTFRLGESEFGVDVFAVHEVLRDQHVAPLPGAPEFVEGVIEVRGVLLPVLDLRRRFALPDPQHDAATRILVAEVGGERLGLVVDRVTEVLSAPETAFSSLPEFVQAAARGSVVTVARLPQRLVLVMDLERVLSGEERLALRELETALADAGYLEGE
jgi:purine-binding chemotaxis protein CheW